MKKFLIVLCIISFFTALKISAADLSNTGNGKIAKYNITREGDFIKISYKVNTQSTPEIKQAMGNNAPTNLDLNMSVIASCKEPKMKILEFDATGIPKDSSMLNTWLPINNAEDYEVIRKACISKEFSK